MWLVLLWHIESFPNFIFLDILFLLGVALVNSLYFQMFLKSFTLTNVNKFEAKKKKKQVLPPEMNLFDGLKSLNLGADLTL